MQAVCSDNYDGSAEKIHVSLLSPFEELPVMMSEKISDFLTLPAFGTDLYYYTIFATSPTYHFRFSMTPAVVSIISGSLLVKDKFRPFVELLSTSGESDLFLPLEFCWAGAVFARKAGREEGGGKTETKKSAHSLARFADLQKVP